MPIIIWFITIMALSTQALAVNPKTSPNCILQSHVCTDTANRTIAGQVISRPCWNWKDTYKCGNGPIIDNCKAYVAAGCSQINSQCLAKLPDGSCATLSQTYQCLAKPQTTTTTQICGTISTCVQGNCFNTTTTPSTDFGRSVAQLAALTAAGASYSSNGIDIFSGTLEHCNNLAVLGFNNCCAASGGKGWGKGLLKSCKPSGKRLVEGRNGGRNHYLGTDCGTKVFGVCTRVREWACVFPSKLARIIQEQGRPQIGIGWGFAATGNCRGFTPTELQQLDFSIMDLSEFISDIMAQMTPINGSAIGNKISNRLKNYYNSGSPAGGRVQ